MPAIMGVAVVLVGLIGVANLVLCFGIIRRLREHTERLDHLGKGHGAEKTMVRNEVMLTAGGQVAEFEASTEDGAALTLGSLGGPALVGFFSLDCSACLESVPKFVEAAQRHPGGRPHVLALVTGSDDGAAAPIVAQLAPVATVSRDRDGVVQKAFDIKGFPAFAIVDDGVVRVSSYDVDALLADAVA